MTKNEFCKKWRRGWKTVYCDGTSAYFFTAEQMLCDLDRVINTAYDEWETYINEYHTKMRINLIDKKRNLLTCRTG